MLKQKLNIHLYPSTLEHESRIYKMVDVMVKSGFVSQVIVIGLWKRGLDYDESFGSRKTLLRIKLFFQSKNIFLKFFANIEWSSRIFFRFLNYPIGIINCHSLSSLPLSVLMKVWHGALLIYEPHELETESFNSTNFRKLITKFLEWLLIKKVDSMFVVSEGIADWYQAQYKIARPTVVLNSPIFQNIINDGYFYKKFNLRKDQLIFLYQGLLSSGRGITGLLNAFTARVDDDVVIIFMGFGQFESKIKETAKAHKNIFFHPAVAPSDVLTFAGSADVGIAYIENSCLSYDLCMPNKLFDYIMAALPILSSSTREMSRFVEDNSIGVVINDLTSATINKAIDKFISLDKKKLRENLRRASKANSWEQQEKKVLFVLQKLHLEK